MKRIFHHAENHTEVFQVEGWDAKILFLPRESLASALESFPLRRAVYFLFCRDEWQTEGVYIGLCEDARVRLMEHCKNEAGGLEGFFWLRALILFLDDMPQEAALYLHRRLVRILESRGRSVNLTGQTFTVPHLPRPDRMALEERVDDVRRILLELHEPCLEPIRNGRVLMFMRRRRR